MRRALLLPSSGNIFSDDHMWKVTKKYLYDVFDTLYVLVNTPSLNSELTEDYRRLYKDRKVVLLPFSDRYLGHIYAMHHLIRAATADTICFVESDFLVYDPSIMENAFKRIETGEIVYAGHPRGFCTPEALHEFRRKYAKMRYEYSDGSVWDWPDISRWPVNLLWYAWWPCGFYADRKTLSDPCYFHYPQIQVGEPISLLDNFVCTEQICYDTFGYAGLILHSKQYKFDIVNLDQYEDNSPIQHVGLRHLVDENSLRDVKFKSIHWCNSSAMLNNSVMMGESSPIASTNDVNTLKNLALTKAYLDLYPNRETSFFLLMNGRFSNFLKTDPNRETIERLASAYVEIMAKRL